MSEVVVITGASAGIGRATALEFARHGARIGLIARDAEALEETLEEVIRAGGSGRVLPLDVSMPDRVEEAASAVERELGPIDVWINGAIVAMYSPVLDMRPEEFQRITEVGYLGQVYGTLAALRRMVPRNRGSIVLIGSGLGYRAVPLQSAYCAAKFALRGFAESLQAELQQMESRINLCYIAPSSVNTPYYTWAKSNMPRRPNAVPPVYEP
ncbi:MAG TPA: SDR family oxidoreductase, partial [Fimbriimonas sp.]